MSPETPDGSFGVQVARRHDSKAYRAQAVVFATGYYDNPNFLRVPGEDLPHVTHYFVEGHPYWHQRVIVIGAGQQQRRRRARVLARRGDGDAGAFRRGVRPDGKGVGAARHRQPGQGGKHCGALALAGSCDHANSRRSVSDADRRGGDAPGRCRTGHDGVPRRHQAAAPARRAGGSGDRRPGSRRGHHGNPDTGVLSGGRHCERKRREPAVHRECPRAWRADRAAPAAMACRRYGRHRSQSAGPTVASSR